MKRDRATHKFKMIKKLAARKASQNRIQRAIRAYEKEVPDVPTKSE